MNAADYSTVNVTSKLNSIFFISDHHFNHENIIKFCKRPFSSVEEMNDTMIENHNKMVKPKDTVYLLGDFAYSNHIPFIRALNGRKTLIIGNHDRMSKAAYDQFTEVIGTPKQPGILQRTIDGKLCIMSHFPMWSWNGSGHGSWHFYGHCHGRKFEEGIFSEFELMQAPAPRLLETVTGLSTAVDVDVWDYRPIPWEVLKSKMEKRQEAWKSYTRRPRKNSIIIRNRMEESDKKDYPEVLASMNRKWRCT